MAATGDFITLYGHGVIVDSTNNAAMMGFDNFELTFEQESIELPGNGNLTPDTFEVAGKKTVKASFSFHRVDANTIALLLGGSTTASTCVEWIEKETATVPSAPGPYTVTLSETPATAGAVFVYSEATTGVRTVLEQVTAASEVAGASYSISGATLTFAAGDADVVYEVDYFASTTAGTQITIEPSDMPNDYALYAAVEGGAYDDSERQMTVVISNFVPKLPDKLGASRDSHDAITVEGSVTGDINIYIKN